MIKQIKLFLLKISIGYKFISYIKTQKDCFSCNAFCVIGYKSFCDRYKFHVSVNYLCAHYAPKQIIGKDRAELGKAKNHILGIFNALKGMIERS
jgi:hypothetical protein